MNEREKDKVLMHSASSICIPVNSPGSDNREFHNAHYEDPKGWARRIFSSLSQLIPGIMHPHAKSVRRWNKIFIFSCLFTGILDTLFLFLLHAKQDNMCIAVNGTMTKAFIVLRSQANLIYLLHMVLKFRLAYFASESRILVEHPKRIALNYLSGYFLVDFFVILPFSQVIMWLVLQKFNGSSRANDAVNFLQAAIEFQYLAMFFRVVLPTVAGQSTSGFIFDSWVKQCLRDACGELWCLDYIYCSHGNTNKRFEDDPTSWEKWKANKNATACFGRGGFQYGIYVEAVSLTTKTNLPIRYLYSLFWGFQQISTMAGNQIPAFFVYEVLFTMSITAMGLVLFSLLVGNMQNFLQALGRKSLEMSVRSLDIEQWMRLRQVPEELRRQARESERYNWAATGGLNESTLLENLPEDLQRDIGRHAYNFVEKFPIFALMDDSILDAIRERLKHKTYIKGSKIMVRGGLIDKIVFIVQGKVESIGEDKNTVLLSEGNVCGEELITSCLVYSGTNRDGKRIRIPVYKLLSNKMVRCLTNVEAYTLRAADLEEVIHLYTGNLIRNPSDQGAIRKESASRQGHGSNRLKLAWRCRKKRLND
ncbi:Cyclic nucleotide-binding domain-containing protein [Heracleum sosnowskyi]|uniref:Cyclic nucleotide-binding domain-containing protein n=1 Tax=Heracleum sosnowskyi TaxID=360622 RepID=A0AAD8IMD9_9APIA|nr:Cyclic nucleotide-binding domain-containing protein [Heracleum sosnowskyi]